MKDFDCTLRRCAKVRRLGKVEMKRMNEEVRWGDRKGCEGKNGDDVSSCVASASHPLKYHSRFHPINNRSFHI